LPWIELKKEYPTRREAREAAQSTINRLDVKLIRASEEKPLKTLVTSRTSR
jgi:hypothetical protein